MNNTILNAILIDIVEIIIVKSDDYYSFKTLKRFIIKLNNKQIKTRIKDKLTKVIYDKISNSIYYGLNNKLNRQYDKPSIINNDMLEYRSNGKLNRINDTPAVCHGGYRNWLVNGSYHRENDLPSGISRTYFMEWRKNGRYSRNNQLPIEITINGNRSYGDGYVTIFDYI